MRRRSRGARVGQTSRSPLLHLRRFGREVGTCWWSRTARFRDRRVPCVVSLATLGMATCPETFTRSRRPVDASVSDRKSQALMAWTKQSTSPGSLFSGMPVMARISAGRRKLIHHATLLASGDTSVVILPNFLLPTCARLAPLG